MQVKERNRRMPYPARSEMSADLSRP